MLRALTAAAVIVGSMLLPQDVVAQPSGQPPLRLVVPFPAGGGTDILARFIGTELSQRINQPVVVVNQSGASGYIATHAVHQAPPDGNTLLLATTNHAIFPATRKDMPFDVVDGFEPVLLVCDGPLVIVANPNFAHKTVPAMIDYAKKNPGKLAYGSAGGIGNVTHLAMELLGTRAKVEFQHVPYRGAAPAIVDAISGHIPLAMSTLVSATPYFEAKKLSWVAQSPRKRSNVASYIPTVTEQTGIDYDLTYWVGIMAPPKTPADRVALLRKEIAAIISTKKAEDFLRSQGFDPKPSTSEEWARFVRSEVKLWIEVGKNAGIKPE